MLSLFFSIGWINSNHGVLNNDLNITWKWDKLTVYSAYGTSALNKICFLKDRFLLIAARK
jgi:hypothetical protein